jgi:hypothetical protein
LISNRQLKSVSVAACLSQVVDNVPAKEGAMGRRLPPLPAIEAFLFAARLSSFRAAAQQLALSPSAFSRRLQTLEAFTGVALFERSALPTLADEMLKIKR